jgi:DNA-binding MarR family transcriptional regulator
MKAARDSTEYAEIVAEVFVETVRKAASKAMCCEIGGDGITPSQMECLQHVYLHGASPITDIARGLEVTLSAASQLIGRLVGKRLVNRRRSEADRRLIQIELTPSGSRAVREMRERRSAWFESMLGRMPASKREVFLDGLESFIQVALAGEEKLDRACVRCGMEHAAFCVVSKLKSERESSRGAE